MTEGIILENFSKWFTSKTGQRRVGKLYVRIRRGIAHQHTKKVREGIKKKVSVNIHLERDRRRKFELS